jgi:signal transduction histidine kinase
MASPLSLDKLDPRLAVICTIVAGLIVFCASVGSTLFFSYNENDRILGYELQTILRGNGLLLQSGDIRLFVDRLPLDHKGYFFELVDITSSQTFKAGQQEFSKFHQCTKESYLKFDLTFCRPFATPWRMIALIGMTILLSFSLFLFLVSRMSKLVVKEFKELFAMASIPYVGELSFTKAWVTAQTMASRFKKFQEDSLENERNKASAEMAKQVSHDIRSPLSALTLLLNQIDSMPEEKRVLIRSSVNRITDIANSLLKNSKNSLKGLGQGELKSCMIGSLVESLVSEKRIALREKGNIEVSAHINRSYGLFAKIDAVEFKRLLSNIVNNSTESLEQTIGKIDLFADSDEANIYLKVCDNGKGIPPHILTKLGKSGVSYGREGTQSGSGLGVYHAKTTVESWGGRFEIESTERQGTTVYISLKREVPPDWFVQKLVYQKNQLVVALDDDSSILEVWKQRFSSPIVDGHIKLITFSSGDRLKEWVAGHRTESLSALYLIDFELLGQDADGLKIIENLKIEQRAILVTSRFEEPVIVERCLNLGVKLIPKGLAPIVPIEIGQIKPKIDAILIDDDIDLIHTVWSLAAKEKGRVVRCFANESDFLAQASVIDTNTPIYIDVCLGYGQSGIFVAENLNKMGFKNLNLATGYSPQEVNVPTYINQVVGKDFPL